MYYEDFIPTLPLTPVSPQSLSEAADVIDMAHDILLHTGVACVEEGKNFGHFAERNCTWQAVAIALGVYDWRSFPNWGVVWDEAMEFALRGVDAPATVLRSALPSPYMNDSLTEDQVFDAFRNASKLVREELARVTSEVS